MTVVADVERLCGEPGCGTVLSRYNDTPWCSVHERAHAGRYFGRHVRETTGDPRRRGGCEP